jgi:simple sugar transport system permease protein
MSDFTNSIKKIFDRKHAGTAKVRKSPLSNRNMQLLIAIGLFFTIMAINRPDTFLSSTNVSSMLVQIADLGIFAMAMAVTMIAGGIDLSIINLANLVAVVNAIILKTIITESMPGATIWMILLLCLVIALVIGFIGGLINSFLIANLGIPEILATLATMNLFSGISHIVTGGRGTIGFPQQLLSIGSGHVLGIPVPFIVFMIIAGILAIFIHRTPYGTHVKLFGLNQKATFFSGINNKKVVYKTHIIACMSAAVAGLLIMARTNSATVDYGGQMILTTLLIGVLSGIPATGGAGNVFNIFLALFLNQLINSGLNLLRVSSFIREMVPAALLIAIVSLEYYLYVVNNRRLNKQALDKNQQMNLNNGNGTGKEAIP